MSGPMTATLDDLYRWAPCWRFEFIDYENRVHALAGRRKHWRWDHVAGLLGKDGLLDEEWYWLATKFLHHIGRDDVNRLSAADIAETTLLSERKAGREPHPNSFRAVQVARDHAKGEATDHELASGCLAAGAVGWTPKLAINSASRSAAQSASWCAATGAEWPRLASWCALYCIPERDKRGRARRKHCNALISTARDAAF